MNDSAVLAAVALVRDTDFVAADEATCRAVLRQSKLGRGFFDAAEDPLRSPEPPRCGPYLSP